MKDKALISLSFDDGRIDNYNILYPLSFIEKIQFTCDLKYNDRLCKRRR